MRAGLVYALKTRCLGALNSRSISICVSVGIVTTAVPLLVSTTIVLLHFLEFFQNNIQPIEALRPRTLVGLHPVVDGLERLAIDRIHPPPPFVANSNERHLREYAQVFGNKRMRQADPPVQVVLV